ncbi:MAG: phage tail assembly chaperone [Hyphomicrobiaceae bacterium]
MAATFGTGLRCRSRSGGRHGQGRGRPGTRPFPWDDVMATGLGVLRLAPAVFWAMTPRELASAIRGAAGLMTNAQPIDRPALETLMRRYPDTTPSQD